MHGCAVTPCTAELYCCTAYAARITIYIDHFRAIQSHQCGALLTHSKMLKKLALFATLLVIAAARPHEHVSMVSFCVRTFYLLRAFMSARCLVTSQSQTDRK